VSFIASIDNVPVSLFLSNARTDMLPIRIWGMMEGRWMCGLRPRQACRSPA
jgi:ABC-type spermidine/putrescine transport system permease subunit II